MQERQKMPSPAVFLDRDGTLIKDRGYLRYPDEVRFFCFTVSALRMLQSHFRLIIVTNQSGISEGIQTPEHVAHVNRYVEQYLKERGVQIQKTYTCPHSRTDGCKCHKPQPYFAIMAAAEFGLDLSQSYMIGDHPHDAEFGRRFGGTGLYVLTGHGEKHRSEVDGGVPIFPDLAKATHWILDRGLMEFRK